MFYTDNFIRDKKLLKELQDEKLWKRFCGPTFHWWDGWWASKPKNVLEFIIENVWKHYGLAGKMAGFEYWTNTYPPGNDMGWHNDKDEAKFKIYREVIRPTLGMVYWPAIKDLKGGYLDVEVNKKVERIEPKSNRLVVFNTGEPHRVTKVISGYRRTFLCNPWKTKPMTFKKADNVNAEFDPVSAPVWEVPGHL